MFRRSRLPCGLLLGLGIVISLTPVRALAGPPHSGADDGPVPGLYLGSDSRGYPYYSGFRWYPGYPLYRAYPDYYGYPDYQRLSYAAGYQPAHPYLLTCLGLRPALWAFPDYYSGHYPAYYAATPDYRSGRAEPPPPGALWDPEGLRAPSPDRPLLDSGLSAPSPRASVSVRVPAGAEVWFDGQKTTASGSIRRFRTPPLTAGNRYAYDVTVRWQEDGQSVTRSQSVFVSAGGNVEVVFPPRPVVAAGEK
jgi:uncharacterized protein (TIGR03000 family)